jgi:hypothetical protein
MFLSSLLGVYRGFGIYFCQAPTAFVLTDLPLQNRREDLWGLRTTGLNTCLGEIAES